MAHHHGNTCLSLISYYVTLVFHTQLLTFFAQGAQLAYMMEDRLKDVVEEVDKEKGLREVDEAIAKEKGMAAKNAEKRAWVAERARNQAEQKWTKMKTKLGEVKLRLAEAKSIISAKDKEIVEMKTALDKSKNKWHNMGFIDLRT